MCKPGKHMSLLWVTETVVFCSRFWRKWWSVWVCKDCILLCQVIKEVPKIHMEYRERTAQLVSGVGWLFITWACFSTWTFVVRCWGSKKRGEHDDHVIHGFQSLDVLVTRIVEVPQVHLQDWIVCCDVLQFLCETYIQNGRLGNNPWVIRKCCNDFWWSLVKWRKGSGSLVGGRGASLQKGPWNSIRWTLLMIQPVGAMVTSHILYAFLMHCMGGCKKL